MIAESEWSDLATAGSSYEEQLDARAASTTYRHRKRSFTGEVERDWLPGPAPPDVALSRTPGATP